MSYALITHHITNTHMGMYCFLNNHNLANFEFYSQNIWYYPVIVQGMQHVLDTAIYKQNKIKKKITPPACWQTYWLVVDGCHDSVFKKV